MNTITIHRPIEREAFAVVRDFATAAELAMAERTRLMAARKATV